MSTTTSSDRLAATTLRDSKHGLDLNLLMLFIDIANSTSIGQAALRLRTPKATLSRKLRTLEQQIGAILVRRGARRLELTEIGVALLNRCERIAAESQVASQVAFERQSELRGTMRISIPFGIGSTWIGAALARFAVEYPQLRLSVHATHRWVDVSEEAFDVAIHVGKVRNELLPARKLAELPRALYAAPAYCSQRGTPRTPSDLAQHDCIMLEGQIADGLWDVAKDRRGAVSPRLTSTDSVVAREMAVAGVGIAMLTEAICEAQVRDEKLVRVLPDHSIPPVMVVAMFLERRHMPLRTRVFIDLLAQAIGRDAGALAAADIG